MNVIIIILQIILAAMLFISAIVAIGYMRIAWIYRKWAKTMGYPCFTYEQLKNFVAFDRIRISDNEDVMLFDYKITEKKSYRYDESFDYIALSSYFDFLRLKRLVKHYEENKRELQTQQKKAEVLQKMQRIINEQYEEIENEVAKK